MDVDCTWPAIAIRQRRVPPEWFRPRPSSSGGRPRAGSLSDVVVMTTAWRRPYYLEQTLASWERARGLSEIRKFSICLGGSPRVAEARKIIEAFAGRVSVPVEVREDDGTLGPVADAPPDGGRPAFEDDGVGFIVIAEEDILVADDVLGAARVGAGAVRGQPRCPRRQRAFLVRAGLGRPRRDRRPGRRPRGRTAAAVFQPVGVGDVAGPLGEGTDLGLRL